MEVEEDDDVERESCNICSGKGYPMIKNGELHCPAHGKINLGSGDNE